MTYDDETSSAMNYYEELGISQQATEQEIRKAHRRLVKLMHPDAQPDQSLKLVAESQMRHLNSIVSTLMDADQRRTYDESLRAAETADQASSNSTSWQGIPWWLASAVGAVVLTLVAVWLWADHFGAAFSSKPSRTVYIPPVDARPALPAASSEQSGSSDAGGSSRVGASYTKPSDGRPPDGSAAARPESRGGISASVVNDPPSPPKALAKQEDTRHADSRVRSTEGRQKHPAEAIRADAKSKVAADRAKVKLAEPKQRMAQANMPANTQVGPVAKPRKNFIIPDGSLIASAARPSGSGGYQMPLPPRVSTQSGHEYIAPSLPVSSLPAAMPPKTPPVTAFVSSNSGAGAGLRDPLEGEWVYSPKEPERRRAGFYPPEFIDLKLFGSGDPGNLRGQYNARYVVTDKPVSPEVNFQLASLTKGSRKFSWQSSDGAKGTLSIDPIDERTIRIDWHTTTATRGPALTSGQATLIRR